MLDFIFWLNNIDNIMWDGFCFIFNSVDINILEK